eukprot:1152541-Pelagomonas_calceolata.AAC.1
MKRATPNWAVLIMRGVWRDVKGVDPREAINWPQINWHQTLFALPFYHNVRKPIRLPGLRAHTLNVKTASWARDFRCAGNTISGLRTGAVGHSMRTKLRFGICTKNSRTPCLLRKEQKVYAGQRPRALRKGVCTQSWGSRDGGPIHYTV